ncbi:MAG: YHYH protein, partial [Verrucomicrobia bacterium]|nr:YHYH protein [Verrucomicrobiota bacterium]
MTSRGRSGSGRRISRSTTRFFSVPRSRVPRTAGPCLRSGRGDTSTPPNPDSFPMDSINQHPAGGARNVSGGWIRSGAAALGLPLLIPIAVAAVAPNLAPFSASFPGGRTLDRPAGTIPPAAQAFAPFQNRLGVSWDADYFYIEGNGLPDHNMMVGITAWQQQVPLPQPYTGDNAWRVPLKPVPAADPAMIEGRFLRGAIALAVNGIPIFNPQNNRGEVSYEIGELDQWGGHCGRADDYHYHIAPVHLETVVGKGRPVAYALDGYPVLGLTEADGSAPKNLDECHGHDHDGTGYHYHAAEKYPYVLGGFHGEVVEAEGQVDPQPRAQGVREALQALRGAEITGFEKTGENAYRLSYSVDGDPRTVRYRIGEDGTFPFEFDDGREGKTSEVYRVRGGGGRDRPPRGGGGGSPEMRPPGGGRPPKGGGGPEMRPPGGGGGAGQRPDPLR